MGIDMGLAFLKEGGTEEEVKNIISKMKTPFIDETSTGYIYDKELAAWKILSRYGYYGAYYTRGCWKDIYSDINYLIKQGFKVMYYSDGYCPKSFVETSKDELKRINEMWLEIGEKPYSEDLKVDWSKWGF
jgi:hypothetical protein